MSPPSRDFSRLSDADLLGECANGEARAWRELVTRYRRLVYGIPQAMGLQPADADEIFQQTFAELLRGLPALRDLSRVEAWLVTTARRASLRLKRDERRRMRLAEAGAMNGSVPAMAPDPAAAVERLREGERVLRDVEALGEPCHKLLIGLFSTPPRSYQEMARELGLAMGSLGPTRARCLERLRLRLARGRGVRSRAEPDPVRGLA
jgi:RNA polymerase sigma factor (sigma-70 family)